jgi:hypothetical protein
MESEAEQPHSLFALTAPAAAGGVMTSHGLRDLV